MSSFRVSLVCLLGDLLMGKTWKLRMYDSKQVVENTRATPCPCFFLNYLVSSAPAGLGWGLGGKAWD